MKHKLSYRPFLRVLLFTPFALFLTAFSAVVNREAVLAYIYTQTPQYEPKAWVEGKDRFPSGASLIVNANAARRAVAPGFYASADAAISFDATHVLFSGKKTAAERWQIWESPVAGGTPRRVSGGDFDCIRPLYLPEANIAYTRVTGKGSHIEIMPLAGGKAARITFAAGNVLTDDVLRDGRILFEAARGAVRELFTVYPDGTGVEAMRCDHGADRAGARQVSTGNVVFGSGKRLAQFTPAYAVEREVAQPDQDSVGPVAEIAPDTWIVTLRNAASGKYALHRWNAASKQTSEFESAAKGQAVEPVIVQARTTPKRFPSALVPTRTSGNLLCMDARITRRAAALSSISKVRVYLSGQTSPLGETEVESDGSFYVQVPADRPLRIELLDAAGKTVMAEHSGFWMRPSEQRICVGCHAGPERSPENKVPQILERTIEPVKMLGAEK